MRALERLEDAKQRGVRLLVNIDEEGYHVREVLGVTHHEESGEVDYNCRPLASSIDLDGLNDALMFAVMKVRKERGDRAPCGGPLPWCEGNEPGCRGGHPIGWTTPDRVTDV